MCGWDDSEVVKQLGIQDLLRCRTCGLVYRDPIITGANLLLNVPEDPGDLSEDADRFFAARKHVFEKILRKAEEFRKPPGTFLDIGCGYGHLVQLAIGSGWRARGLDVTRKAVEHCVGRGLDVFHGTLEELSPGEETFDAVAMMGVLEYLSDPFAELARIEKILKPGGVLMIRALNSNFHLAAHRLYKKAEGALSRLGFRDPSMFHRFEFSPGVLRYAAGRAGLATVAMFPSPSSRDDPYDYVEGSGTKKLLARMVGAYDGASGALYGLSRGRAIMSPSFGAVFVKGEFNRRAKVLHVITRMDCGGSAVNTANMIKNADRERYEPSLLCGSVSQLSATDEAELRNACAEFAVEPALRRNPHPFYDPAALFGIYRFIKSRDFDIVHTHTSKAGFVGRLAAHFAHVPVIIHSPHGHVFYGYFHPLKTRLYITLEKIGAKVSDRILCFTMLAIRDHIELGIGRREQFREMKSGVPVEQFMSPARDPQTVRAELGIPAGSKVIGNVARLDPVKGVRYLIRAFGILSGARDDVRLVLVGDGEEKAELAALVKDMGIEGKVCFAGQRSDVPDLLHAMDVFVLPSLNEGYGRVVVEAMSAGLPIVASRVGGVPTLVEDGENGLLVPAGDPEAIAAAAGRILDNPQLAAEMSEASRKLVSANHSVEAVQGILEENYRNLLITLIPENILKVKRF